METVVFAYSFWPFYLVYAGFFGSFVGLVVYGTWISSRYLRHRYPSCSTWKSRGFALLKQLAGCLIWAYFGSMADSLFFVDARYSYRVAQAVPCAIALYFTAFTILSHAFESPSPRATATNAVCWVGWDFATISIPIYCLVRLW